MFDTHYMYLKGENENHTSKLELKMNVVDPKLIDVINSQEEYIKKLEELLKNLEDSNKLKDEIIKNQKTQIEKDY